MIDQHAAAFILQGALDRLARLARRRRHDRRHRRAVAGLPADRRRASLLRRWLIARGRALGRARAAALLRDVPGAAGRIAVARRPLQGAGARGRRHAARRRAADGRALPRAAAAARAPSRRRRRRPSRRCSRARRAGRPSWRCAVAGNLYGDLGLALASVAMVAMIPVLNALSVWVLVRYASPGTPDWRSRRCSRSRSNPLIWACVDRRSRSIRSPAWIPQPAHAFVDALGRSSLALGLLIVGAGLRIEELIRPNAADVARPARSSSSCMPAIAIAHRRSPAAFPARTSRWSRAARRCRPSSNSYVLARQMGGDAPLMAQILTLRDRARGGHDAGRAQPGVVDEAGGPCGPPVLESMLVARRPCQRPAIAT